MSELCETFARDGSENRLTVAEIIVGRLMAHAGFACHLAHAEPVEPTLFNQGQARLQHLLAEIGGVSHGRKFFASAA